MTIQIFFKDIMKEYFFQNIMDGRHSIDLYSYESGLPEDVELFIDINNGVWKVNEKNILVYDNNGNICNDYELKTDEILLVKTKISDDKIGVLIYENNEGTTIFKKYIIENRAVEVGRNGVIGLDFNNGVNRYFTLDSDNGKMYLIPHINRVYHKGKIVNDKKRIRFGDVISCKKFKLIYMGNVIAVNNPDGCVKCSMDKFKYENDNREFLTADESINEDSEFIRSPRITHKLIKETIEIDPPTAKKDKKERPLLYTIGPSLTMSMAMIVSVIFMVKSSSSGRSVIPSMLMAVSMFMGAVLWPLLSRKFSKKQAAEEEKMRMDKYKEYIDRIDVDLGKKVLYNREVYDELYPSLENIIRFVLKRSNDLWNHSPYEEGFLDVRVGKGSRKLTIDINIQKERFTLEDDPLRKYASVIQNKYMYITNVPISVNLHEINILGIVGNRSKQIDLVKLILIRLAVTHCYDEVKFAVIFNKKEADYWNFTKWLPHSWSRGKKERLLADDKDGAYYVINTLREIAEERLNLDKNTKESKHIPHYVIFITDYELVSMDSGIRDFVENSNNMGMTFIFAYDSIGRLPNSCKNIIQLSADECTIYDKNDNSGKMISFVPDISEGVNVQKIAEVLASIKISELSEETLVPERLSFLGLYKAKNIDELVIARRWKESQSFKSLEAPIGIGSGDEIFSLNIHEKFHGPHGLIAGTTGSGKSEFIQSLILSMAINYHPYDVAFVLIDYKGGGMANAFVKLPHVAGTITNLEGNQIKRSLVSLQSELKRRQAIFKEYMVNHIDQYQVKYKKGLAVDPLPHLVIISDEFAELKSQEPEFMNELISTARIGRSLGVHLILATQKPSGVVNDQIWSNTRFRICLKVADRMDSKEMLKRDEAVSITQPGRCYVQVGNDEIFKLIQSGYSGEKYFGNESNFSDDNAVSIACINLQGNELYKVSRKKTDSEDTEETQLSAAVDYISEYAKELQITPLKLWLPPLSKEIFIKDIEKRPGGFNGSEWIPCLDWLDPVIGMYDEPEKQKQGLLDTNFGQNGHLILYGSPGTGKTTFIQTLIYALAQRYSPDYVNIYIMDFGSRSLSYCKFLPHTADVMFSDDNDKIKKFFSRINSELAIRKKCLAEYGVGNLLSYMQASDSVMPAIMIVIDNYAAFTELYSEYENEIIKLSREGANYGIYLVFTSSSVNGIKRRISENFKMVYTLQLNDNYDYAAVLGRTEGVFPENVKGRGLVRIGNVLEFHTALAVKAINEAERVPIIKNIFVNMAESWKGNVPNPLPVMPEDMDIETVITSDEYVYAISEEMIPLGYDIENIDLVNIDTNENHIYKICGDSKTGKTNMLACIIRSFNKGEVWLVDGEKGSLKNLLKERKPDRYACNSDEMEKLINDMMLEAVKRHNEFKDYEESCGEISKDEFMKRYPKMIFILDDFDNFFNSVSNECLDRFGIILNRFEGLGINIIVSCTPAEYSKYRGQKSVRNIFMASMGVLFGNPDNFNMFGITIPYNEKKNMEVSAGKGYFVKDGKYTAIRTPFAG